MESAGLRSRQRQQRPPSHLPAPRQAPTQSKQNAPSRPSQLQPQPTSRLPLSLITGYTPPLFTINLSHPPHHRYDHVAAALQPALARINFAALLSETLALFFPPATPSWLAASAVHLLRFASRVLLRRLHSCEETAELRGIARETGIGMDLLVAFNVALDLLMGCTSGGVRVQSAGTSSSVGETAGGPSRMVHFRTLDWDMDELRQLVVELEFVRAEGGPVVARTVGYFGYVGVLTGVREGLSVSLNFRAGQELERRKLWALRWHLAMVVLGRRRGVASVLRGYLLGEGRVRKKGGGWLIRGGEGKGEVETPPNIDDILADLARSPSTAAYLIFCTPSRVYSVEKGYRTASVQSSSEFLTTCNHDVADEPDPSRIHAAAQHVASQGMAEIIDESFERKEAVEHVWRQKLRLRRKTRRHRGEAVEAVTEEDVLHMLGHEDITYGGTHYAVVMDPESGGILWRRVYQTDDLRGESEPVATEPPQLPSAGSPHGLQQWLQHTMEDVALGTDKRR